MSGYVSPYYYKLAGDQSACVRVSMLAGLRACMHSWVCACVLECVHVCVHVCANKFVHVSMYT